MCGILGLVGPDNGAELSITPAQMMRMRDLMRHRGPDGEGLVRHRNVCFAHRRLAVIDPDHGRQPMWSPDRRFLLVYNGELYNDAELRQDLCDKHGVQFLTECDTETVLHAFALWGVGAFTRMRGMFALGIYDFQLKMLTLARDPLGIKPLYFAQLDNEVVFASHIPSILAHPKSSTTPNLGVVSSYLSTVRTTLGQETLFSGVMTLRPGQLAQVRWNQAAPTISGLDYWREPEQVHHEATFEESAEAVREAVIKSVSAHLRSDVPRCMLLSGGLDSSIIAVVCRDLGVDADVMRTWCAGTDPSDGDDVAHARLMAQAVGSDHHEVTLDETAFFEVWALLVDQIGLPLTTPNETAIYAVARDLKPHATVALTGEGADELFAGYAGPFLSGIDGLRSGADPQGWPGDEPARERYRLELMEQYGQIDLADPIEHYLRCNSWIAPQDKVQLLTDEARAAISGDAALHAELRWQFERDPKTLDPAERLLHVHRRLNLTGLLRRLDTATMLAGVEGRTPFADVRLAGLAMSLPLDHKIAIDPVGDGGWSSAAAVLAGNRVETKRLLRAAFAEVIPEVIMQRPKASFPMPFQGWLGHATEALQSNQFVAHVFRPEAIRMVTQDPQTNWQIAWPILNIAMWSRRWWG